MACNDTVAIVNQNGVCKAELFDSPRNLGNLFLGMGAGIALARS